METVNTTVNENVEKQEIMIRPELVDISKEAEILFREEVKQKSPFAPRIAMVNKNLNRMHVLLQMFDECYKSVKEYADERETTMLWAMQEPVTRQMVKPLEDSRYWQKFHAEGLEVQAEHEFQKLTNLRNTYKQMEDAWVQNEVAMWKAKAERLNRKRVQKWNAYCERAGIPEQKMQEV